MARISEKRKKNLASRATSRLALELACEILFSLEATSRARRRVAAARIRPGCPTGESDLAW
ncbi:hypothetical protein [Bradyrhizobium sp.]|jgi:hypothetical protein|uniref:hypothetical protein n=1 Tax=Bradyrhizobium sp. TaxID=376 RepID=UPI002BB0D9BE|nr:hypothetical protein [Bradyrhizobium sp.]HWX57221.1 hypothetical protein [Bradyrhizobium sp.]